MSHHNRKRKHRPRSDSIPYRKPSPETSEFQFLSHHESYRQTPKDQEQLDPLRALYTQAHEADIVHGPAAEAAARSLEVVEYRVEDGTVTLAPMIGSSLIELKSGDTDSGIHPQMEHDSDGLPASTLNHAAYPSIWVDRYDARLLLDADSIPQATSLEGSESVPASPSGWSDMPSDTEDMFFFTPDEIEHFHREKRRRLLEQTREERLKARLQEDGMDEESKDEDVWGGSDEEPDGTQKELMHRTASHILSSPNPAQLEMRILTNHGSDRRFAFLRGRWKRAWNLAKAKARIEKAKTESEERARLTEKSIPKPAGLGIVAGYGSDSDDSAQDDGEDGTKHSGLLINQPIVAGPTLLITKDEAQYVLDPEDAAKEAKRQRLKRWMEQRKAGKSEIP